MFDLLDPDTFLNGHPFSDYTDMRLNNPVMRHAGHATQPDFWVLTRYDDIVAVSHDNQNFTSTQGFRVQTANRAMMDPKIAQVLGRFMMAMDNPEHNTYRNLVRDLFLPAALAKYERSIIDMAQTHLDSFLGHRDADFVNDIAFNVPIKTICKIIGVPQEDEAKVIAWTNAVFATDDPEFTRSLEDANNNYLAIFDYAMSLVDKKRTSPGDDMMSKLVRADIEGRPLDDVELKSFFSNMIAAGNETTRTSLAIVIWTLGVDRDARKMLIKNPDLIDNAVDEILRFFSPIYQMARVATADIVISGQEIKAGERVAMLYGAGNRDPKQFKDPDRLDLNRANAGRNVVFGTGIHHCLGNRLGNMQIKIIITEFLKRFPDYEIDGAPVFLRNNFVAAIKSLKIRLS